MGFTRLGRRHRAVLSSGGKGEGMLLAQPSRIPPPHLSGLPRALPLHRSLRIPVRQRALKHGELCVIPPWRVPASQRPATALTLAVTPWPR